MRHGLLSHTLLLLLLNLLLLNTSGQNRVVDSAKADFLVNKKSEEESIKACFFIADQYMDLEQYDSSQTWLNKIHEKLPFKVVSIFNYFLLSRQAEVYYYNNLQQLGLQESFKGLDIAKQLNDSIILMDSYNFLGLFYMNLDSLQKAVSFFREGLQYVQEHPDYTKYIPLSMPFHIHGNLSEAYFKLKLYTRALEHAVISLQRAIRQNRPRGVALAHDILGDIFLEQNRLDSSFFHYQNGKMVAVENLDVDVELLCLAGLAKVLNKKKQLAESYIILDAGFLLLKKFPNINRFFSLQFLESAIEVFTENRNNEKLADALTLKSQIETENLKNNNSQLQTVLNAGVANEKKVLEFQVKEALQRQKLANTRLLIMAAAFLILVLIFLFYRNVQNQKLSVAFMRHKISQDLHDDIGASLSSLQIYAAVADQTLSNTPDKAREMINKIKTQSRDIQETMGDIVWSMKSNSTGRSTLEAKVKNYATELLEDKEIQFTCIIEPEADEALSSMKARRNVHMIIREVLNNTVKYSQATQATLHIYLQNKTWVMDISDNGIGMSSNKPSTGNGLRNIKERTEELKGSLKVNADQGTRYLFRFPKSIISDTGW